ncbi:thioredoxin domain-containing protein [Hymenobacter sp. CRA2]|uniref:thioredoxin domain-containing protein n=1 Tax=Hymenobacter sp. CRA2 TaxID=1955620 RepID=UPI00098E9CF0|nr:thioredoxin domain-containing protein [Hymenobacter sp. CRA2]OON69257.1 hypothetical protein B0919_08140 [Hymenobacter sp. CRA2]
MRVIISALALSLAVLSGCGRDAHLVGSKPVSTIEYYAQPSLDPLAALVAQQAAQAKTPILYFYADWCGPCRRFRETLADKQVQAALQNATSTLTRIPKG